MTLWIISSKNRCINGHMQMPVGELMSPNTMRNPNASNHGVESYQLVVRTGKRKVDMPFLNEAWARKQRLGEEIDFEGFAAVTFPNLAFTIPWVRRHGFAAFALSMELSTQWPDHGPKKMKVAMGRVCFFCRWEVIELPELVGCNSKSRI